MTRRGLPVGTVIVLFVLALVVLVEIWVVSANWDWVTSGIGNALLTLAICLFPLAAIGSGIRGAVRHERRQPGRR